jgi:HSP20 family protein
MTLVKAKPTSTMMPSFFSDFFDTSRLFNTNWFENEFSQWMPSVNILEDGQRFRIELAAPGFTRNDFKVNLDGDILTISAEKKEEHKEKDSRFTRKEFTYNSFSRSFTLPQSVDPQKIDAKYEEGILKFSLPKKEEAKKLPAKEIKIS